MVILLSHGHFTLYSKSHWIFKISLAESWKLELRALHYVPSLKSHITPNYLYGNIIWEFGAKEIRLGDKIGSSKNWNPI